MSSIICSTYSSPLGELKLGDFCNQLVLCDWTYRKMRTPIDKRIQSFFGAEFEYGESELIQNVIKQLSEYFEGKRKDFEIHIAFCGTPFQVEVWKQLQSIPYGTTSTYLQLSQKLGNEKAIRAVATANGANAHAIIVPCHRIIGSDGSLVGYAGGLSTKKKLLELEAQSKQYKLFE